MQTAQDQTPVHPQPVPSPATIHPGGAESAPASLAPAEHIQPVSSEVDIPKELEQAGVSKVGGTIEIPPDVAKLGVTHSGASMPPPPPVPTVSVPLNDQQIVAGLQAPLTSALLWLSAWCIKKMKKAGIAIQVVHGKIVRTNAK